MRVDITGRHIEVTEPLKRFAEDRIQKMHGVVEDIMEVHLVLTVEKHQRHEAEANIKTKHDFHHVAETSVDMYTSIAAVFDKVEKQLLRSKEKTVSRKRHGSTEKAEALEPEA
jgi:putative sigma-54 modulation protein